jgi:hypothetical protein
LKRKDGACHSSVFASGAYFLVCDNTEGREGKGREGKGREGKGREGKGREGKGRLGGRWGEGDEWRRWRNGTGPYFDLQRQFCILTELSTSIRL